MNAASDAVPEAASLDMPATPARVWQAIHIAGLVPKERRKKMSRPIAAATCKCIDQGLNFYF
jgi:hypothetical protein